MIVTKFTKQETQTLDEAQIILSEKVKQERANRHELGINIPESEYDSQGIMIESLGKAIVRLAVVRQQEKQATTGYPNPVKTALGNTIPEFIN